MDASQSLPVRLMPRQTVPALQVALAGGGRWKLRDELTERFLLLAFYRGLHCPLCSRYVSELDRLLPQFEKLKTRAVGISMDSEERAQAAKSDWKIRQLSIGYGLSWQSAMSWGLYLSAGMGKTSAGIDEPFVFNEPALFLVSSDATLYYSTVQTMPFARPNLGELANAIEFVNQRGYPARGDVVHPAPAPTGA